MFSEENINQYTELKKSNSRSYGQGIMRRPSDFADDLDDENSIKRVDVDSDKSPLAHEDEFDMDQFTFTMRHLYAKK